MKTIFENLGNTACLTNMITTNEVSQLDEDVKIEESIEYLKDVAFIQSILRGQLSYVQDVILDSLIYRQYYTLKAFIAKNKVTKVDIIDVMEKANDIKKIFDIPDVINKIEL